MGARGKEGFSMTMTMTMNEHHAGAIWAIPMTPGAKLLLLALAGFADDRGDGEGAMPELMVATSGGQSEVAVLDHLDGLEHRGLVAVHQRRTVEGALRLAYSVTPSKAAVGAAAP